MVQTKFSQENDAFVIENYNQARAFSSFLPGIAGQFGKPMWVFYTNRGQCVASFGVKNRDGEMLEFYPANKAYTVTPLLGFRTFLRLRQGKSWQVYEPFAVHPGFDVRQILKIRAHEIELEETNKDLGIRIRVVVFNAPNEDLPVLVRQVTLENLGNRPFQAELLDGLPQVVPYGLNEWLLKHMSRTMEAFAEVPHQKEGLPFFKLKTEPSDKPEVHWINGGFFVFSIKNGKTLKILVDKETIFGSDTAFLKPQQFAIGKAVQSAPQCAASQFACAFSFTPLTIGPHRSEKMSSFYGQADAWEQAETFRSRVLAASSYAEAKRDENAAVIEQVMSPFAVHSASAKLDAYSRYTYLDNVLRGGQPIVFTNGSASQSFHGYSRKHGDMERDYNFFELSPTYYSQGNGNFRDVNQNRRSESFLHENLGAGNIETFFNLLQLDGYNPLVIQEEKFEVEGKFVRPGDLFETFLKTTGSREEAEGEMNRTLAHARKVQESVHQEGFWVDHWTYNLDLLESYAAVFPDLMKALLVERKDFTFYDSDHTVQPRQKKYVLRSDGAVRQMHAVILDPAKVALFRQRKEDVHKVRTDSGTGPIYQTSLLGKMLALIAIKSATLDPFGVGLEMESEKPGWCDALNGMPGLLGSSVNEAFELKRWVVFLLDRLPGLVEAKDVHSVAVEVADLMKAIQETLALSRAGDFFKTWDTLASLREGFRDRTRLGVSGDEKAMSGEDIEAFLRQVLATLSEGLRRSYTPDGLCVTYFINDVADYEKLPSPQRSDDHEAAPPAYVRALRFKQTPLSYFLEGPMHALRVTHDLKQARRLYDAVKGSELYDRKLKMYKLNVPLEKETYEIGRNKVFPPGWLENESIFLHMHYKFLLEVLRSGLSKEFYDEMRHGIVAFLDPERYGRSPLENSSFIASSCFPDSRVHGSGFVARLSGSTAEWISMIFTMGLGPAPFQYRGETLRFEPTPVLAHWLFSKKADEAFGKDTFGLKLFGKTWIVYHNPTQRDTFDGKGLRPASYRLRYGDGQEVVHSGRFLPDALARDLRDGKLSRVTIDLK